MSAAPNTLASDFSFHAFSVRRGAGTAALRLHRRLESPLRPQEVRVRIHAVALNHRDLMLLDGRAGPADRELVPGSDAAGEVVEIGSEVSCLRVGDRVISGFFPDWLSGPADEQVTTRALGGSLDGVLAEQVVLPASAWIPMPAHLSFVEAATLSCAGVTAWHALFGLEPLPPGATVAVLGTGGVSIWALQLAKAAGLRVLLTSAHNDKLQRARALGADGTLNYREVSDWGAALHRMADGRGVERVLDIGGSDTLAQSITALRQGGSVAVIGRLSGSAPAQFDPAQLFLGNKRLVGLMVGSRAMAINLARFVEQQQLRPVIDRVFPHAQTAEAFEYLASGGHFGKVVIEFERRPAQPIPSLLSDRGPAIDRSARGQENRP